MDQLCDRHEEYGNLCMALVGKFVGMRLIGLRLDEYNIKMNLKEIGYDDVERIYPAQDKDNLNSVLL